MQHIQQTRGEHKLDVHGFLAEKFLKLDCDWYFPVPVHMCLDASLETIEFLNSGFFFFFWGGEMAMKTNLLTWFASMNKPYACRRLFGDHPWPS